MDGTAPFDSENIDAAWRRAWALLVVAVATRRGPIHTPTLVNVAADGTPQARTVVLRNADPDLWTLRFHTDRRAEKFATLSARPHVAVHAYDPAAKVQLRLSGTLALHRDDAIADNAWATSRAMSRVCYAQRATPGTQLSAPHLPLVATGMDEDFGRQNFSAAIVHVDRLEWLYLLAQGHRRAAFTRSLDGSLTQQWLAP